MRRAWLIVLVLVGWFWPRSALAFEFTDYVGELHAPLVVKGSERLCIALPAGNTDPVGCEGYDISAFDKIGKDASAAKVIGAAFITDGDDQIMVIVTRSDGAASSSDFQTQGSAMEGGLEMGQKGNLHGVRTIRKDHKIVQIANRDALQVDIDLDMPPDAATKNLFGHTRYVVVPSGDVDYVVATSSSLANAARTDEVSSRILMKLTAKPSTKHHSKAFKEGQAIGYVIGILFGILIVIGVIVTVIIVATRRKPAPAYAPWGGGYQQGYGQPGAYGPPPQGMPSQGMSSQGMPQQGMPQQGPSQYGPPPQGAPPGPPPAQDPGAFYSLRSNPPPGDPPQGS